MRGSDFVLWKIEQLGGRRAPGKRLVVPAATVATAHVVDDIDQGVQLAVDLGHGQLVPGDEIGMARRLHLEAFQPLRLALQGLGLPRLDPRDHDGGFLQLFEGSLDALKAFFATRVHGSIIAVFTST
jgi:hypothetical protein